METLNSGVGSLDPFREPSQIPLLINAIASDGRGAVALVHGETTKVFQYHYHSMVGDMTTASWPAAAFKGFNIGVACPYRTIDSWLNPLKIYRYATSNLTNFFASGAVSKAATLMCQVDTKVLRFLENSFLIRPNGRGMLIGEHTYWWIWQ